MPRSSTRLRRRECQRRRPQVVDSDDNERKEAAIPIGSQVRKWFEGHGWFQGDVESYDAKTGFYKVVYPEDGDEEELDRAGLQEILIVLNDDSPEDGDDDDDDDDDEFMEEVGENLDESMQDDVIPAASAASPAKAKRTTSVVVTPSPSAKKKKKSRSKSPSTTPRALRRESLVDTTDNDYSPNEEGDDDDDEFVVEQPDEDDIIPDATAAASTSAKRATPGPTAKKKKTPKKKSPSVLKRKSSSSSSTSKKSSRSKSSSSSSDSKKSARTIAVWGLPRGALAKCSISGLTIRSLDGIPPLCPTSSSSFLLHASERKKNTKDDEDANSPLPGKIIVAAQDEKGIICPPECVGKTFDSVAALHSALLPGSAGCSKLAITYDMQVVGDPAFSPWHFCYARLQSSGLLNGDDPLLFVVQIQWDGKSKISGAVSWYKNFMADEKNELQWAVIENEQKDLPSVLVGVPVSLVLSGNAGSQVNAQQVLETNEDTSGEDMLPPPTSRVERIRLPASLLQKAICRGNGLCSPAPLLEACTKLLLRNNNNKSDAGSTLTMLKTLWGCMLVDASPFDDAEECLGLPSLLLLSLVAKADPEWVMPAPLRRAAVTAALRTATAAPSQPWVGFVNRSDKWYRLERTATTAATATNVADDKALNLRNILRAAQAVVGGRLAWGRWDKFVGDASAAAALSYLNHAQWDGSHLPPAPPPSANERAALLGWEAGKRPDVPSEPRLGRLDEECRLSSIEPGVMPHTLVLLQAVLSRPPSNWKKHGLPSLSRQIRKLISEVNSRMQERVQLARLATWGKKQTGSTPATTGGSVEQDKSQGETSVTATYKSFREAATPTGTLSDQEIEVVDCFEAIQEWVSTRINRKPAPATHDESGTLTTLSPTKFTSGEGHENYIQVKAGPPLTTFGGRVAFLLAFATSIEVKICPDPQSPSKTEVVNAMFCGNAKDPLLVQRIGKARLEGREAATVGGTTSGATAVPSLGYVQRNRSDEEARIFEEAENAVAEYWKGGKTTPLPLPPVGLQWDLPQNVDFKDIAWEEKETAVGRTAELVEDCNGKKTWHFTIAGRDVGAFDARAVVSPCALDLDDNSHRPVKLEGGSERDRLLRLALYIEDSSMDIKYGKTVLAAMARLHTLAESDRAREGLSEGYVYDWMPLACASPIPSRTWRDALLAIRTREKDHVILGKGVRSDGTGAPRDMVEGVLVRLFHALEMLFPQALRKEGALKFRVRPRGAAYYQLLTNLERLGRGEHLIGSPKKILKSQKRKEAGAKRKRALTTEQGERQSVQPSKRPRRSAAVAASKKTLAQVKEETLSNSALYKGDDTGESLVEQDNDEEEFLPLPKIETTLWAHQEASVSKVVEGVREGRRGHADASAVGAGKTLTALATIVRLAHWVEESGRSRHGTLVMLPTKALIKEWLLEICQHTKGFHVIEQREDGTLFSLTYGKNHPPIDGNSLVISTLDRVCNHPFVRQAAWDFVVIDECLSVQNAAAKRNPSAWRQIEVSMCGVLMLSATFFRSKFDQLFYMIRMLRSPLPRTIEWLPATIHEHIVCQVPETDRTWQMRGEMVPLMPQDLRSYRDIIEGFRRKQVNRPSEVDGRKLWVDLESFLRSKYEGRETKTTFRKTTVMGDAFAKATKKLLRKGRRPLIFADTSQEGDFLLRTLCNQGLDACSWASIASRRISESSKAEGCSSKTVIVAVKTVEGQGINMQRHADAIICRPTPGDFLEQMKGRIDRPGQSTKQLLLVVLVAEHTIEEAKFANIRLAGNFFREYIAPVATKYKERINLNATLAAGGSKKLKAGTVSGAWKRSLEAAGQSGAFADFDEKASTSTATMNIESEAEIMEKEFVSEKKARSSQGKEEPKYKPLNKVLRNKGDPQAVRQAKSLAKSGQASLAVRRWLFPPKSVRAARQKGLAKQSLMRFSDTVPPIVLNRKTVYKAVTHLSNSDPKLASLIARVGPDALVNDCGDPMPPTQARFFDRCVRAITFTVVSVDAGNAFLRRLAMKIGACVERKASTVRKRLLDGFLLSIQEGGGMKLSSTSRLLQLLVDGRHNEVTFTHTMLRELVNDCEIIKGKQTGYPHLCGVTFPCGKNDDHSVFVAKARAHANGGSDPVSCGFSKDKAGFIISLVEDFESGKISCEKIAKASDREAARMLMELKGIGDWCAGGVLMHFLSRADIMLYGDLTIRNYLNDLYDINHLDESETLLESAADFADTGPNRNLIDEKAIEKGWAPYRSVVCYLMYHLQEENLVLL